MLGEVLSFNMYSWTQTISLKYIKLLAIFDLFHNMKVIISNVQKTFLRLNYIKREIPSKIRPDLDNDEQNSFLCTQHY